MSDNCCEAHGLVRPCDDCAEQGVIEVGLYEKVQTELAEMEASFELRWNADQRAIKRWQEKTGRHEVWPDHADLCVFLMEENKTLKVELAQFQHDERVGKIGFCAVTNCKHCPSPYDKPTTRTPCSIHKGFKEDCGCP